MGVGVIPAAESSPVSDPLEMGPTLSSKLLKPSTRHLYALKWFILSAWCQDRDLNPVTSDVSVVLSFLQGMLNKQRPSFTIEFTWQP